VDSLSFTIMTLPRRALSTNGNKRDRHEVSDAKGEMGSWAYTSMLEQHGPDIPQFRGSRVDILLMFHVKHHAKTGDGLYRPLDPSNIGGECIKPVIDYGLCKTGVIEDDSYKHVRYVVLGIENEPDLSRERIEVTVKAVEEELT